MLYSKLITGSKGVSGGRAQRMNKIEMKLEGLSQKKLKHLQESQVDGMVARIAESERKLGEQIRATELRLRQLKEHLLEANRKETELVKKCQLSKRIHAAEVAELQRRVHSLLILENKERKETQARLMRIFQEKTNNIAYELDQLAKQRHKYFEEFENKLENTLPVVDYDIVKEIEDGEKRLDTLEKELMGELAWLKQAVDKERDGRDQSFKKIILMIKEVTEEVKKDIEEESRLREENKQHIVTLFQNACKKLMM